MTEPKNREPRLSAGAIVVILVIIGFLVSGAGLYWLVTTQSGTFGSRISLPTTKGPADGGGIPLDKVERSEPTPAQAAALANGQSAAWKAHGLTWTVPAGWQQQTDTDEQFVWKSADDTAWMSVTATPMPAAIAGSGLAAIYEEALNQEHMGNYTEVRLLEIDNVLGVQFRESAPADPTAPQRLHWHAYQTAGDAARLLNVVVYAPVESFPERSDALHAVLYSMKVSV